MYWAAYAFDFRASYAPYLASIYPKYSSIWVYDSLNATWIRGTPDLVLGPGEGMWIYMTTPATLIPQ
jgi:hypothetical protein